MRIKKLSSLQLFLFFILGCCLSIFFFIHSDRGFTIISIPDNSVDLTYFNKEIVPKKNFNLIFTAKENYLGSVILHINSFGPKKNDILIFKIKEKNSNSWYYQSRYNTTQMYYLPSFPFGFPPIPDSKNKQYLVELESLKGSHDDAVGISSAEPLIVATYKYPKSLLLANIKNLIELTGIKIQVFASNTNNSTSIIIFFFPFLYLLTWILSRKRYFSVTLILLLTILFDVFILHLQEEIIFIILAILWIWHSIINRFSSSVSYMAVIFFFSLSLIILLFHNIKAADEASIWAYVFLFSGIILNISELKSSTKRSEFNTFLNTVWSSAIYQILIYSITLIIWGFLSIVLDLLTFFGISLMITKYIYKKIGIILFTVILSIYIIFISVTSIYTVKIATNVYKLVKTEQLKQLRISLNPKINIIQPSIVYYSTKVVLYGHGFDPRSDRSTTVFLVGAQRQTENVRIDYIDNTKIIFTVPLHWNTGLLHFFVEVPVYWQGKRIIAKSNVVAIKLIPRINPKFPDFSPDDDAFFRQLKTLTPEVRKLNGYE